MLSPFTLILITKFGAGNETRTRDLYLGKVSLYQLSYSRVKKVCILAIFGLVSRLKRMYFHYSVAMLLKHK